MEYLNQLKEHLPTLLDSFRPGLVLFDAGVDPHEKDELGRLNLTDQGTNMTVISSILHNDYYLEETRFHY